MGVAVLAATLSTDVGGLVVFAILYGVGHVGPFLRPLLVARYFGTRSIGALSELNETMNIGGAFIGPIVGGVIYDRVGAYTGDGVLHGVHRPIDGVLRGYPSPRTPSDAEMGASSVAPTAQRDNATTRSRAPGRPNTPALVR